MNDGPLNRENARDMSLQHSQLDLSIDEVDDNPDGPQMIPVRSIQDVQSLYNITEAVSRSSDKELQLQSSRSQSYESGLIIIIVGFACVVFCALYWLNAVSLHSQISALLWVSPAMTIFTIGLLGTVTALLLNAVVLVSLERLKWTSSLETGLNLLDFIALSRNTSYNTLLMLLFACSSKSRNKKETQSQITHFRFWSGLRYSFN